MFDLERFEDLSKQNGIRFWLAHELMEELEYSSWNVFREVVNKAIASCARLGLEIMDSFIPHAFIDKSGKEQRTYKLTRFACLLVTMHADDRKPKVSSAKALLAGIASQLIEAQLANNSIGRVDSRHDLMGSESELNRAAASAGVRSEEFGIFKDSGFRGMYNMSLKELKERKGISHKLVAYDFMGLTELAGNLFRVTQTAERLKNMPNAGLRQAQKSAKEIGADVRAMMIRNNGIPPEDLPIETDVKRVKSQLKKTNKKMRKLDKK